MKLDTYLFAKEFKPYCLLSGTAEHFESTHLVGPWNMSNLPIWQSPTVPICSFGPDCVLDCVRWRLHILFYKLDEIILLKKGNFWYWQDFWNVHFQVWTSWEAHIIWKNLPHGFDKSADLLSKRQNHEEFIFQIMCASQEVQTLKYSKLIRCLILAVWFAQNLG